MALLFLALAVGASAPACAQPPGEATITGVVAAVEPSGGHPAQPGFELRTANSDGAVLILDDPKGRDVAFLVGRRLAVTGVVSRNLTGQRLVRIRTYQIESIPPMTAGEHGGRIIYRGGATDAAGRFMGGTEMRVLAGFDGRLFAANGFWSDVPNGVDPTPVGPQVLVLDRPDAMWRVDTEFPQFQSSNNLGISFLEPARFERDGGGRRLARPVDLLFAGGTGSNEVFVRGTGDSGWRPTGLAARVGTVARRNQSTRAAVAYRDPTTATTYIFVGVNGSGVWRGLYDPDLAGRIAWDREPDLVMAGSRGRILGLAVVDDRVIASVGTEVLRRKPGPTPHWDPVFAMSDPQNNALQAGVRKVTGMPRQGRAGSDLLVGYEGNRARAMLVDPAAGAPAKPVFALEQLFPQSRYGLVDYDGAAILPGPDPVALFGISVVYGRSGYFGLERDAIIAWYAASGRSGQFRLNDDSLPEMPALVAARRIILSPFAVETGRFVYAAGMDIYGNPAHNSAWIMKLPIASVRAAIDAPPGAGMEPAPAPTAQDNR